MNPVYRNVLIRDLCLVAGFGILTLVTHNLPPHYTTVLEGDMSISRPVSNTFPTIPYLLLIYVLTLIPLFLWYYFTEKKTKWNVYHVVMFILMSFMITEGVTQTMKIYTGRPRPAFFDICGYPKTKIGELEMYGIPGRIADITKCTASKSDINDAFMSYPSGHSSHSMCVGLYTFLLIGRCLNEVKWIKSGVMKYIQSLVFLACMIIPIVIGGSRIYDYKHSEADVVAGYAVGIICTMIAYYIVYGTSFARYSMKLDEPSTPKVNNSVYLCLFYLYYL